MCHIFGLDSTCFKYKRVHVLQVFDMGVSFMLARLGMFPTLCMFPTAFATRRGRRRKLTCAHAGKMLGASRERLNP